MCTCLNYSWGDLATLVPHSAMRMFCRLLRKILQFVCLLCLGTIKTRGQATGTALFTCQGCDSREMKQSRSGEQMFPHATSPQRGTDYSSHRESDVWTAGCVGTETGWGRVMKNPGIPGITEGLLYDKTVLSLLILSPPHTVTLVKLNPEFSHII